MHEVNLEEYRRLIYAPDTHIIRKNEVLQSVYYVISGKIKIYTSIHGRKQFLGMLGKGCLLAGESVLENYQSRFDAETVTETELLQISADSFRNRLEGIPSQITQWLENAIRRNLGTFYQGMNTVNLYGICNSSLSYIRLLHEPVNVKDVKLKAPLSIVVEELYKTLPLSRDMILRALYLFSESGLLDIFNTDSLNRRIQIPDQQLFRNYIQYLQVSADLPSGMYNQAGSEKTVRLCTESEKLIDGMMLDLELRERMFYPDKAMVHLNHPMINRIYQLGGGKGDLPPNHPCIEEMVKMGTITRILDNRMQSVFADLRNVLRLNIQRDPEVNFADITEYICEELAGE